jgi:response regulator RpfG family c-di-GMP phosphodiesterase
MDLMMPEIDGFGVLEELKLDQRTQNIPVIVVSAKDLSDTERERLEGNIEAIYQKGSMPPRSFVDQVVEVLEHKTADERLNTQEDVDQSTSTPQVEEGPNAS